MTTFSLSIRLGNDAMQTRDDVAGALRAVVERLEQNSQDTAKIYDENGNAVGTWSLK